MTANDMMTLRALLEKSSDADVLREMIGFTAERLMALEVEGLTGAAHGERSPERITHRNGYRERSWETRAGTVALKIPKLRKGSYFPGFLEPRRMAEKATLVSRAASHRGLYEHLAADPSVVRFACCEHGDPTRRIADRIPTPVVLPVETLVNCALFQRLLKRCPCLRSRT